MCPVMFATWPTKLNISLLYILGSLFFSAALSIFFLSFFERPWKCSNGGYTNKCYWSQYMCQETCATNGPILSFLPNCRCRHAEKKHIVFTEGGLAPDHPLLQPPYSIPPPCLFCPSFPLHSLTCCDSCRQFGQRMGRSSTCCCSSVWEATDGPLHMLLAVILWRYFHCRKELWLAALPCVGLQCKRVIAFLFRQISSMEVSSLDQDPASWSIHGGGWVHHLHSCHSPSKNCTSSC